MDSMPISKFKATCLASLERVRKTGQPLRVTRFGKPMADIVPATPTPPKKAWLGDMAGSLRIVGDITCPSDDLVDWEATK
jgi:antitoxin (DNA-binding transcriptional repressor) of toxin-antitoxin stability system